MLWIFHLCLSALIDGLVNSGAATEDNLSPLLAQLSSALDTSAVRLEALEGKVDPNRGGTEQQVADEVGTIYTVSILRPNPFR